ncbi:hypothetical protein SDC9_145755 [bioreactor metagenome]|uniref:Uncharacterized protein n=1 Tax=bioreactor metagenome TaxID=1076179 RepID=A0A645E9G6_9ZZZZ
MRACGRCWRIRAGPGSTGRALQSASAGWWCSAPPGRSTIVRSWRPRRVRRAHAAARRHGPARQAPGWLRSAAARSPPDRGDVAAPPIARLRARPARRFRAVRRFRHRPGQIRARYAQRCGLPPPAPAARRATIGDCTRPPTRGRPHAHRARAQSATARARRAVVLPADLRAPSAAARPNWWRPGAGSRAATTAHARARRRRPRPCGPDRAAPREGSWLGGLRCGRLRSACS